MPTLVKKSPFPLEPAFIPQLTAAAKDIRLTLKAQGIRGAGGEVIDHVEFFGAALGKGADSRSFVLCPDDAYDRSPCGTGTSAKIACLAADGVLEPGKVWIQESILGSRFEASYRLGARGEVIPSIAGRAYVTGEGTLFRNPSDPFVNGITPVSCSSLAEAR